ncbi:c-type cytochrome [Histidinibacterium lentulum]|uniref:Cytochrome c n=1 Tax=Histidinibacterium lentulum TaxID=2480588 RepID=A0A3N2QM74_9RHOB|nr:cytochrome c [Histidinibacterium lentulum]ROT96298.1 cytochrome c [Histidinibacterium lentulum]
MRGRIIALALAALPVAAAAQEDAAELYAQHCAYCHGADATGDGPLAPALILQPPDLTRLSARNEGVFPVERVVMRIDGREPLVSHGSPMPVYGPFFDRGRQAAIATASGQPILAAEAVVALTEYLRELQQ